MRVFQPIDETDRPSLIMTDSTLPNRWFSRYLPLNGKKMNDVGTLSEIGFTEYIFKQDPYLYFTTLTEDDIFGNIYGVTMSGAEQCGVSIKHIAMQDDVKFNNKELKMKDLDMLFEGIYIDLVKLDSTYEIFFYIQPHADIDSKGVASISIDKRTKYKFEDLDVEPKVVNSFRLRDSDLKIDGSFILIDITPPGSILPEIVVFFVGEIENLIGV